MAPYQVIKGLFDHAPTTDAAPSFPNRPPCFGLSNRLVTERWGEICEILTTTKDGPTKLIIIARHGQGIHNLGQIKYGLEKWKREMCFKYGDDDLRWGPDAPLSSVGEAQAAAVGLVWLNELAATPPIPTPTSFYTSPLRRAAKTLSLTFDQVPSIGDIGPHVKVRENLREKMDAHTPDQRMAMRIMRSEHPTWPTEQGAEEDDVYWKADWVESFEEYERRAGQVVEEIFQSNEQCVSITAHEGIIQALLHYINHPVAQPPPGCAFGVLVRKIVT